MSTERCHDCAFTHGTEASNSPHTLVIANMHPDTRRLRWAFGDPENGASREDIERLLADATNIEEARLMIDEHIDLAMSAPAKGETDA